MPTKTCPDEKASPVRPDTLTENAHTSVMRRTARVALRLFALVNAGEATIHHWLMRYSVTALRISMGLVYVSFGILKYFPGISPAQDLALATTHLLSFGLVPAVVPNGVAMMLIATLECAIGLLLIAGRWLRLAICLLAVQLAGILSPVVLLAARLFAGDVSRRTGSPGGGPTRGHLAPTDKSVSNPLALETGSHSSVSGLVCPVSCQRLRMPSF